MKTQMHVQLKLTVHFMHFLSDFKHYEIKVFDIKKNFLTRFFWRKMTTTHLVVPSS
jgi:hypothetical protein